MWYARDGICCEIEIPADRVWMAIALADKYLLPALTGEDLIRYQRILDDDERRRNEG